MGDEKPSTVVDLEVQEATKSAKFNEGKDDKYKSEPKGKVSFAHYIVCMTRTILSSYCN